MNATTLKIIACVSMLIDHIGAVFFPRIYILRLIGRISFPIFGFMIAEGFFYTKNVKKYLIRLVLLALLSEIPYDFAFSGKLIDLTRQNIFFTLTIALIGIIVYDKYKNTNITIATVSVFVLSVIAFICKTDYDLFGVLIIFGFYLYRGNFIRISLNLIFYSILMCISHVLVSGSYSVFNFFQLVAILSLIFISKYNNQKGYNFKLLFYGFYPLHLILIGLMLIN